MGWMKNAARFVYRVLPEGGIKRKLTCIAYQSMYPGYVREYSYRDGVFTLVMSDGETVKSVKDFDPEPLVEDFRELKLTPGSVVVDLGGNLGVVAIYLASKVGPSGRVYVYEPDEKNYPRMEENIRLNGASNITAVKKGAWKEDGVLEFYSGGNYTSTFQKTSYVEKEKDKYEVVRVPVSKLDSEVSRLSIERLDLLKIDIEGSEVAALEGARETLLRFKPELIIETHIVDGVSTADAVVAFLRQTGYSDIRVKGGGKMPNVFARF
jgi:FkbM family methyltransferase